MTTKVCTKCGIEKDEEEFKLRKDTGKRRNVCRECDSERSKKWRDEHKDEIKIKHYIWYEQHKNDEDFINGRKEYTRCVKDRKREYDKIYNVKNKNRRKEYYQRTKIEFKPRVEKYREDNKDYLINYRINQYHYIRLEVLKYYSNEKLICNICGENHLKLLEIDHIGGGGRQWRRDTKHNNIYTYLYHGNFPDREKYQVLCSNCNQKVRKIELKIIKLNTFVNISKKQKRQTIQKSEVKFDVFDHYKTNDKIQCVCCGEDDMDVLTMDHINNDGAKHRKEISGSTQCSSDKMYRNIQQNNYPDTFRILCYNCNQVLAKYAYCPHILEDINEVRKLVYERSARRIEYEHKYYKEYNININLNIKDLYKEHIRNEKDEENTIKDRKYRESRKEELKQLHHKWYEEHKTNEDYILRLRENDKNYRERHKNDPEYILKQKARSKEYHNRKKQEMLLIGVENDNLS